MYVNTTSRVPNPLALPTDETILAIGDVRGHCERLKALHQTMGEPWADSLRTASIVHPGEDIDRCRDSKASLDFLPGLTNGDATLARFPGDRDRVRIELVRPEPDEDFDRRGARPRYDNGGIHTMNRLGVDGRERLIESSAMAEPGRMRE